jgi:crotonobetainyl-CoA:carnitine CoA-transferase CaiB-like acyl-CoA transferase
MPILVEGIDLVFSTFDAGRQLGCAADLEVPEVTTSTFVTTGPYAHLRGGPLAAWAAGGYLYITGEPDREPLMEPEHICEYVNGYTAAVAAEAALRERRTLDRAVGPSGRRVDVGAMESMIPMHQ